MTKEIIVLDTNILLVSLSKKSIYRPIFDALLQGEFILALSNEIISEYIEIIELKTNSIIAQNIANTLLNLENVLKIDVHYKWNLIEQDYDDNKFVDCAIATNAKVIVTNDKHFKILQKIDFPKVEIMSANKFIEDLQKH